MTVKTPVKIPDCFGTVDIEENSNGWSSTGVCVGCILTRRCRDLKDIIYNAREDVRE
jgi:hypothetical protein